MTAAALDDVQRRRLRWRARRGLLENDVILSRFFERHEHELDTHSAQALGVLLDQTDNDLLDLLLERTQPSGRIDTAPVRALLARLRSL
jgi:antitoxin CptB